MFRIISCLGVSCAVVTLMLSACSSDNPVTPLSAPVADFTWSGDSITPATVVFTNLSQNANQYRWDFADGITSIVANPTHVFQNSQTYQIVLIASDSLSGKSDTSIQNLTIGRPDPVADFTWCGDSIAPAAITFINLSRNAVQAYWDFDDGTRTTLLSPTHIFATARVYNVMLVAIDTISQKRSTVNRNLTIVPGDPIADFAWTGETAVGEIVTLHNHSRNADQFYWKTTGDWFTSNTDPRVIFDQSGDYPISLVARSSATAKVDTVTKVLTITPALFHVSLVRIRINQIPFTDSLGLPWDQGNGPDIIIMMYDPVGEAVLCAGEVIMNLRPDQLPIALIPQSPLDLSREHWNGDYRIDFHELAIGVAPFGRLLGQVSFGINNLLQTQGLRDVYCLANDSLKVDIGLSWR